MLYQLALWGEPHPVNPTPIPSPPAGRGTESAIIAELRWLNRRCGPVSAAHLAGFIGKSPRMAQYTMNRLADAGLVQRVGQRGGWIAKTAIR